MVEENALLHVIMESDGCYQAALMPYSQIIKS